MKLKNAIKACAAVTLMSSCFALLGNATNAEAKSISSYGDSFESTYRGDTIDLYQYIDTCYNYAQLYQASSEQLNASGYRYGVTNYYGNYVYNFMGDDYDSEFRVYAMYDDPITSFIPKEFFTSKGDHASFGTKYGYYIHTAPDLSVQVLGYGNMNHPLRNDVMIFEYNLYKEDDKIKFTPTVILNTSYYTYKEYSDNAFCDYNYHRTAKYIFTNADSDHFTDSDSQYFVVPKLVEKNEATTRKDVYDYSGYRPQYMFIPTMEETAFAFNPIINFNTGNDVATKISLKYYSNNLDTIDQSKTNFDSLAFIKNLFSEFTGVSEEDQYSAAEKLMELTEQLPVLDTVAKIYSKVFAVFKSIDSSIIYPTLTRAKSQYNNTHFAKSITAELGVWSETSRIADLMQRDTTSAIKDLDDQLFELHGQFAKPSLSYSCLFGYKKGNYYYFPEIKFEKDSFSTENIPDYKLTTISTDESIESNGFIRFGEDDLNHSKDFRITKGNNRATVSSYWCQPGYRYYVRVVKVGTGKVYKNYTFRYANEIIALFSEDGTYRVYLGIIGEDKSKRSNSSNSMPKSKIEVLTVHVPYNKSGCR